MNLLNELMRNMGRGSMVWYGYGMDLVPQRVREMG